MCLPDQYRGTRDNEGQKEEADFRIPVDRFANPIFTTVKGKLCALSSPV